MSEHAQITLWKQDRKLGKKRNWSGDFQDAFPVQNKQMLPKRAPWKKEE